MQMDFFIQNHNIENQATTTQWLETGQKTTVERGAQIIQIWTRKVCIFEANKLKWPCYTSLHIGHFVLESVWKTILNTGMTEK